MVIVNEGASAASTVSLSACHLLQVMFEALTEGMKKEMRGKEEAILPEPSLELRSMLHHLIDMLPASSMSGDGRDSAINLLVKQVPRKSLKNPGNSLTLAEESSRIYRNCTRGRGWAAAHRQHSFELLRST